MIDDDGWWFMMMGIQYISRYQIWSNQEQVRETYVNGSHTPPSDRNRKKRQDPHQRQNKVDILRGPQFALTRYTKITKITKDKQNTIKLLHSAWFNDTWLNYMDPWLSPYVTMVHLSRAPSHRNRHVKHRRERVPPESICRLHSGTGGIFLSTSVHAAFNSISCGAVDREKNEAPPGWSKLFSGSLWCHVVPISWFFPRILFWIKALDFC